MAKNQISSKRLIRQTLIFLMSKKKYDDITVKDICEKANLSRMTFYRNYSSKDDIFKEYTDERFQDFYFIISKDDVLNLDTFSIQLFEYLKKYQTQIEILRTANKEFMLLNQFRNYSSYLLAKFKLESKYNRVNKDLVLFLAGGLYSLLLSWLENKMKQSPQEMADLFVSLIKKPLLD